MIHHPSVRRPDAPTRREPIRWRRTGAALIAATLLVVACGDDTTTTTTTGSATTPGSGTAANDGATGDSIDTSSGGDAAPAVLEPAPSDNPDAAPIGEMLAPYEDFGTDAAPGEFPRTIRHAMGETTIAAEPERIVTLDTGELDSAIELGIKPVGTVDYGADALPEYITPQEIEGIEVVGTIDALNFEQIRQLDPDLILSSKLRHESDYDTLSQIAPTVFADGVGVSWKQNFELFAQALGREDRAADTVARYEQRVGELNAMLPNPRPAVSITRIMEESLRLYQRANFLAMLLTDLGFPRPETQNVDDFGIDVSLEQIPDADADIVLLAVFDKTENGYQDRVLQSPLWESLSAVQDDTVYEVDDQTWLGGIGYHAAFEIMDQMKKMFAAS